MMTNPKLIRSLEQELDETNTTIDKIAEALRVERVKQRSLEETISLLTGKPMPDLHHGNVVGSVSIKDQMLQLLTINTTGLRASEIVGLLGQNGRTTSAASVSSQLTMMKKNKLVVNRNAKWFVTPPKMPEPKPTSD